MTGHDDPQPTNEDLSAVQDRDGRSTLSRDVSTLAHAVTGLRDETARLRTENRAAATKERWGRWVSIVVVTVAVIGMFQIHDLHVATCHSHELAIREAAGAPVCDLMFPIHDHGSGVLWRLLGVILYSAVVGLVLALPTLAVGAAKRMEREDDHETV